MKSTVRIVIQSLHIVFFLIAGMTIFHTMPIGVADSRIRLVPDEYPSIQEAINAAAPGDTVQVAPSVYHENIVVNKTLTLIAENQDATINGTAGNLGSVVLVTARNASIIGFTIRGGRAGVFLHGRKDLEVATIVKGNKIIDATYGIYVYWSNGSFVKENTVINNTHGIYVYWSSAHITGNIIEKNSNGTLIEGSRSSTYSENTFKDNTCSIYIKWSQVPHIIHHNNFINNIQNVHTSGGATHTWDHGYPSGGNYWNDCNGTDLFTGVYQNETGSDGLGDSPYFIDENNIDHYPLMNPWTVSQEPKTWTVNNDGPADFHAIQEAINAANKRDIIYVHGGTYHENIIVNKTVTLIGENYDTTVVNGTGEGPTVYVGADNVTVKGFTIRNGEHGLEIRDSANGTLEENKIFGERFDGIRIINSSGINVIHNIISRHPQHGIYIYQSTYNNIFNNTITNDGRWSVGIVVYYSNNNKIDGNKVTGTVDNEGGIGLLRSANNTVINNIIVNTNWCGISLRYADKNTITGNTITDNKWFGMRISYSDGNHIYRNNFINNANHISLVSTNATWDHDGLGNYWNDHALFDSDFDGVSDIWYQIDQNNIDRFPLMGKFYAFTTHKDFEHEVLVISNSTITNFTYLTYTDSQSSQTDSIVKFNVTGQNESLGFCRITVPHHFIEGPYKITVNNSPPIMETEIPHASNTTHTTLYFQYHHSTKQIIIIYEFPSLSYLAAILVISLIMTLAKKKNFG